MKTLGIDLETYSSNDLKKCGVYKYVEADDFAILLFAYSVDDGPTQIVDFASGQVLPSDVAKALTDPNVLKTAWNANFERTCLAAYFAEDFPPEQWECTMVKATMLGLPAALGNCAKVLNLPQEKDLSGIHLIRYFSIACKPTAANGGRTRNLPEHDPVRWQNFINYCIKDVDVEKAIRRKIAFYNMPEKERLLWAIDQRINDRGVKLDKKLVKKAVEMDIEVRKHLMDEAVRITGLENPNSVSKLIYWLSLETEDEIVTLKKSDIPVMLQKYTDDKVIRVLEIRQELAKTSVKKYVAMANGMTSDGRVKGLVQFYGANRTGRWAGRLVQIQNLPQNKLKDLDLARELVKQGDLDILEMNFGSVPDTLSQLIRTAFVASPGHTLAVADFSAIEARVIAWLADEKWRMEVFNTHGKIYEASAAQMFKVPLESVTKGSDLRQKGKVSELALGYQGGTNALINMGALKMGIPEEELQGLVDVWREANPAIVRMWTDIENAAVSAVRGVPVSFPRIGLKFFMHKGLLLIQLPSGRALSYYHPELKTGKYGKPSLCYQGTDQITKKWGYITTYGGKLVENIVQAIARDCLAETMHKISKKYNIVLHVHDEVAAEVPQENAEQCLEEITAIMAERIPWAPDLPLTADGYITKYYRKD